MEGGNWTDSEHLYQIAVTFQDGALKQRAMELMETVFQDYPDAGFLDRMLLRWVVAAYRMQNYPLAKQKAEQLLTDYPNSKQAEKAREVIEAISKMSAATSAEAPAK